MLGDRFPYKTLGGFRRAWREYGEKHGGHRGFWEAKRDRVRERNDESRKVLRADMRYLNSDAYKAKYESMFEGEFVPGRVMRLAIKCITNNNGCNDETGVFADLKGHKQLFFYGKNGVARFDVESIDKYAPGTLILIHNHPNGESFSEADIETLNEFPCIESMIAAGHDGTVYRISIGAGDRLVSTAVDNKIAREYWTVRQCTRNDENHGEKSQMEV